MLPVVQGKGVRTAHQENKGKQVQKDHLESKATREHQVMKEHQVRTELKVKVVRTANLEYPAFKVRKAHQDSTIRYWTK